MTRYGFAIKALPQGAKPFGEEDDEKEETAGTEEASLGVSDPEASGEDLPEDPTAAPAAPAEDPAAPPDPSATDGPPEGEGDGDPGAVPPQPDDDSRPWAGDEYNEGDETNPDNAFAAYTGSDGEQAWLDQAQDGTLTGWVRDSTGQVWHYTDPDAWATDVDGAQMTRTHGPEGDGTTDPTAPGGQAPAEDRGVQDPMFASQ
ncbi:hypothetical protein [Streptomyces sp. NPDC005799]|uniref:hypothetical protein n=1 Tax=Streptomyces sp. NPDC005799 TaxID=3154678 RepID=UPI0033F41BB7